MRKGAAQMGTNQCLSEDTSKAFDQLRQDRVQVVVRGTDFFRHYWSIHLTFVM